MTHSITTKWDHNFHFTSGLDNQVIHFDATALSGNHTEGVSPKKILLSGLSGCTGMDVVSLLDKFKINFSDFSIDVDGELTETNPKYYNKIQMVYTILVAEADKDKVTEAVQLSITKYCGVYAMFSKAATITHQIKFL